MVHGVRMPMNQLGRILPMSAPITVKRTPSTALVAAGASTGKPDALRKMTAPIAPSAATIARRRTA
jgi:hypothetical protein